MAAALRLDAVVHLVNAATGNEAADVERTERALSILREGIRPGVTLATTEQAAATLLRPATSPDALSPAVTVSALLALDVDELEEVGIGERP